MNKAQRIINLVEQELPTDKIREFAALQKELDQIEARTKVVKAKSSALEQELLPIIQGAKDQMVIVDNAIIKAKERKVTSGSYKELFETSLGKVNQQIKDILLQLKQQTIVSKPKPYLDVTQEAVGSTIKGWISSLWSKLTGLKNSVQELVKITGGN